MSEIVRRVPVAGPPAADAVDTVIDLLAPPPPNGVARGLPVGKAGQGPPAVPGLGGVVDRS